jgi:hypothetical protein
VLLALGLDVVATFNRLGLSKGSTSIPCAGITGSAPFSRMRFLMRAVLSPQSPTTLWMRSHGQSAHTSKKPLLSLGWKKLEIQDPIEANDHMYGPPYPFSTSACGLRSFIFFLAPDLCRWRGTRHLSTKTMSTHSFLRLCK